MYFYFKVKLYFKLISIYEFDDLVILNCDSLLEALESKAISNWKIIDASCSLEYFYLVVNCFFSETTESTESLYASSMECAFP